MGNEYVKEFKGKLWLGGHPIALVNGTWGVWFIWLRRVYG